MAHPVRSDEQLADELVNQARMLDQRAESLRTQARELASQAAGLRAEAASIVRAPVELVKDFAERERDPLVLNRVRQCVRQIGPCKSSAVAEHCGISQMRALRALTALEGDSVKRTGLKRGTLWSDIDDDSLSDTGQRPDAETLVRDAARKLGCFAYPEIREQLHYLSDVTIRRWLVAFVERGTLTEEKVGVAKLYEYAKPTGPTPARPRATPPEQVIVEHARRSAARPVRGTGRGRRSGNTLVNALLREVRSIGDSRVEIVKTAHSFTFRIDEIVVASCSLTPGATSLKETRRDLIKAGIPVKP